jgi:hypothetical protein
MLLISWCTASRLRSLNVLSVLVVAGKPIATCRDFAHDLQDGFWIGGIDTLYINLGSTGNAALPLIYTLYSSPLHKH